MWYSGTTTMGSAIAQSYRRPRDVQLPFIHVHDDIMLCISYFPFVNLVPLTRGLASVDGNCFDKPSKIPLVGFNHRMIGQPMGQPITTHTAQIIRLVGARVEKAVKLDIDNYWEVSSVI